MLHACGCFDGYIQTHFVILDSLPTTGYLRYLPRIIPSIDEVYRYLDVVYMDDDFFTHHSTAENILQVCTECGLPDC